MAIALVPGQLVTGTGALVLNGVTAGNLLVCWQNVYRVASTQAPVATPTDSVGSNFSVANADVPAFFVTNTHDVGVGIFYKANAEAGTHTVTPEAATVDHGTLAEFSGMKTTGVLDVEESAKTENTAHTSQVTGTTAATAQNDELVCIAHVVGAAVGDDPIGYTNPVSGFTTAQIINQDQTDLGTFHAYKIISTTGTQSATFNWTTSESQMSSHACIATLKGDTGEPPPEDTVTWVGYIG